MVKICVFGPSNGEGIIIASKDILIVIDAYGTSKKTNHIAWCIREKLNKETIDILAMTHTHSDHYMGIPYLLENFNVSNLWTFPNLAIEYQKIAIELAKNLYISEKPALKILDDYKNEFKNLLEKIRAFAKKKKNAMFPSSIQPIGGSFFTKQLPSGDHISIRIAGPSALFNMDPEEYFIKKQKISLKDVGIHGDEPNLFSSIIELKFNNLNFLFLGDANNRSIEHFTQFDMSNIEYDFIKVSHHGSPNGNPVSFWEKIALQKKPCKAAITNHCSHSLPKAEVVNMVRNAVKQTGGDLICVPQNLEQPFIEFEF